VATSADFDKALRFVLSFEGGYVNDPRDPGGETRYGISKRAHPDVDIKNLTREQAAHIYYRSYWLPAGCQALPGPLALVHFDSGVQHGVGQAREFLADSRGDIELYLSQRLDFYTRIGSFNVFGRGWTRRMAALIFAADDSPHGSLLPVDAVYLHQKGEAAPMVYSLDRERPARVVGSKLMCNLS
jgi:lysozyme family protein